MRRWEAVDGKKGGSVWKSLLYGGLAIVSVILLSIAADMLFHYENLISTMGASQFIDFFHNSPKITEEQVASRLTPEQKLLVFGDLSKTSPEQRIKARWDTDPNNPTYFADYTNAYLAEFKKLPPDFLLTAKRIDPGNAWFTYVSAGFKAKGAVKLRTPSKAAKLAKTPPEWDIPDAGALNDSILLLHEARNQPKCVNPSVSLHEDQMKLLPTGTPSEVIFALGYRSANSLDAEYLLGNLGSAIAAKAWLCGPENNRTAFKELLVDADAFFTKRMEADVNSLWSEIITTNMAFGFVTSASPVATQFGLTDESAELGMALENMNRRKALFESRKGIPNADLLYQHGGELANMTTLSNPKLERPPLLTEDDVQAGRMMDHETVAWTGSYFIWAMLVAGMGLTALFRFRSPLLIRRLTGRLEMLIYPRDWMATLGFGVVLPMLFFVWITRFTALGGRELSMERYKLYLPYLHDPPLGQEQWVALALLVVCSSATASCGCLWKRMKPLGLVKAGSATSLIPIACLAAYIPMTGWAVVDNSNSIAIASWVVGGIVTCWLVLILAKAFFGRYQIQLRYGLVARMLVPCCAFAALLALSAAPYFKARAFYWSRKDMLVRADPERPSGSHFDHKMALQFKKELRETLGK